MANKSFIVQYLIKARDGFSRAAKTSAASTERLKKQVRETDKAFKDMETRTGKATKGLSRFRREARRSDSALGDLSGRATAGFKRMAAAAAGFFAVQNFFAKGIAFQDALADLSAITGATGKDLEFLKNESLRLAKTSITSADQVATAFKIIASAKSELLEDPKGLSDVTEQVLLLANAARLDLTVAANVTTQALNQFGVGADQAARFVNVLAAGSKIGASEVGETGVAIVKAGAVAKAVGVNFEELNAALQVLAKGGVKAEVAGTGLKTALLAMEKLPRRMRPSVVGLGQALENLGEKSLTVGQMQKIFGSEAVVIGQILSENAGLVKEWTRALTGTNIAQQQAAVNTATFSKKMQRVKAIVDEKLIKLFLRLAPTIERMAVSFGEFLEGVDEGNVEAFALAMEGILIVLSKVASLVGDVISAFVGLGRILGEGVAAVITGDFSQFSDELKKFVFAEDAQMKAISLAATDAALTVNAPAGAMAAGSVAVGVTVGLDQGLRQTGAATVAGTGVGALRADVGAN